MRGHLCKWGEQCDLLRSWHRVMERRVRVYDNGGETADRYTVEIYRQERGRKVTDIYFMSLNPESPLGVNQYGLTLNRGEHVDSSNAKRVKVQDLPAEVIRAIEHRI